MSKPPRFGHVVLRTNQLSAMSAWYCTVLGARVVARNEVLCFLTYDDEHHRVALVDVGPLAPSRQDTPGLAHVAFGHATLTDLLDTYDLLGAAGVAPTRAVNHSFTASLYYRDPDGNEMELFCDTGEPVWAVALPNRSSSAWDPDAMMQRRSDGASEDELRSTLSRFSAVVAR